MKTIKAFFSLIRVKHYLKNVLVFLPLVFSVNLTNPEKLIPTLIGFLAFCLGASVIYIVNDIRDIEKDRKHSTKCKRPLPSGAISVKAAIGIAIVFGIAVAGLMTFLCLFYGASLWSVVWIAAYIALNFGYSFRLKNVPIVDLIILASGFVIRVLFGGAVAGIEVSEWLLLVMASGALYLGMGKRKGELLKEGDGTRAVNRRYNVGFLERNMYLCLSLTLVFYALWCITSGTIEHFANGQAIIWSVLWVLVIVLRYNYLIEGESDGDPVSVLTHDPMLMVLALGYALYMLFVVYIPIGG